MTTMTDTAIRKAAKQHVPLSATAYKKELATIKKQINSAFKQHTYRTYDYWANLISVGDNYFDNCFDYHWQSFWIVWQMTAQYSGTVNKRTMKTDCETHIKPLLDKYQETTEKYIDAIRLRDNPQDYYEVYLADQ